MAFLLGLALLAPAWGQRLHLALDDLHGPLFAARGLSAELRLAGSRPLILDIAELRVGSRLWRGLRLTCAASHIGTDRIECRDGRLAAEPALRLSFVYRPHGRALDLDIAGADGERWRLRRRERPGGTVIELEASDGALARLAPHLPGSWPVPNAGRLSGWATLRLDRAGRIEVGAEGRIAGLAFTDPAGLRAGEGVGAGFRLRARRAEAWAGEVELDWDRGEVFWSPLFLPAGTRHLQAAGRFVDGAFLLEHARLRWEGIGSAELSGRWRPGRGVESLNIRSEGLELQTLWQTSLRPLFAGTVAGELALGGRLRGEAEIAGGSLVRADAEVEEGHVAHARGLFVLDGLRARLPWRSAGEASGMIAASGGRLGGVGLGAFAAEIQAKAGGWAVERLALPLLDGELQLQDLRLLRDSRAGAGWRAEGAAALRPVSMTQLSEALGWPRMHGTLSALVPRLEWREGTLSAEGAILFRVFDGTVVVKNLRMQELAGPAPRAQADVDMRRIDLDLLTRTFSFGRMEGRLDVTVGGLELAQWKPVRFSASVASSPGDYPRRISQRAVDNIAALGGGSAAAALQKSFLRVFEDFRYRHIGLAGHLEQGVLTLSGLAAHNDGFVIVEGGGIPALTVIGYNRQVGWNELLERLSRIRQGSAPVIR